MIVRHCVIDSRRDDQLDRLTCLECGDEVIVPRRQTLVLSTRQLGHECGGSTWAIPPYTTRRKRTVS